MPAAARRLVLSPAEDSIARCLLEEQPHRAQPWAPALRLRSAQWLAVRLAATEWMLRARLLPVVLQA